MFKMSSLSSEQEKGQGLVEYALILALVAIVVIGSLITLGPIVGNSFSTINNSISRFGGASGGSVISIAPTSSPVPTSHPTSVPSPTFTYQQWCASLGPPNHINPQGKCVPGQKGGQGNGEGQGQNEGNH